MFLNPPLKTDAVNRTSLLGTISTLSFGAEIHVTLLALDIERALAYTPTAISILKGESFRRIAIRLFPRAAALSFAKNGGAHRHERRCAARLGRVGCPGVQDHHWEGARALWIRFSNFLFRLPYEIAVRRGAACHRSGWEPVRLARHWRERSSFVQELQWKADVAF